MLNVKRGQGLGLKDTGPYNQSRSQFHRSDLACFSYALSEPNLSCSTSQKWNLNLKPSPLARPPIYQSLKPRNYSSAAYVNDEPLNE